MMKLIYIVVWTLVITASSQLDTEYSDEHQDFYEKDELGKNGEVNKVELQKAEAFYQKINSTIRLQLELYPKRVDCIINEMKNMKVIDSLEKSEYEFVSAENGYNVTFTDKERIFETLQPAIDDANFRCVIVGYCAIITIITVMLIVVACVSCLSKRK